MAGLEDAVHKLDRGKEQLESLYHEFNSAFKRDSLEIGIEKNPYTPTYDSIVPHIAYTIFFERVPEITKRQAIMTGVVTQSFRIALDYLAWAFAMKHGRIKKKARGSVYYPLAFKSKGFDWRLKRVLSNPSPEHRAFFQKYQPYRRTHEGRALRYLTILSNRDKHKVIIPNLIWPPEGELDILLSGGVRVPLDLDHLGIGRNIKNGTKLRTVLVASSTPDSVKMDVKLKSITIIPIFQASLIKPPPPYKISGVEETLNRISDTCTKIITEAEDCF